MAVVFFRLPLKTIEKTAFLERLEKNDVLQSGG